MPVKRPAPVTPDKLENLAKHIGETATHLRAVAESMRLDNFEEMGVASYDQMQRAMKYLDNFISAARGGLREKRDSEGQFPRVNGKSE
jgi:hypothetical protein